MGLLRESEQCIELLQVRRFYGDVRRGRKPGSRLGECDRCVRCQRCVTGQQHAQGVVDGGLAGVGRVVQDLQIIAGPAAFVARRAESVVGDAEPRRREHRFPVGVVRECPRLADQRVDHVPVVHGVLVSPHESRQRVDELVRVPDLDPVGEQPRFDPFADEPAVHRVDVAVDVDQTAGVDAARHLQARRNPLGWQRPERRDFLGEAVFSAGVAGRDQVAQERGVLVAGRKFPAAAEQQGLVDGRLEVPVRRLDVAVFVGLPHVDPLARDAVVREQIAVPGLEFPPLREVVDGGGETVAAVSPGRSAEFPQGILQAIGEGLERLRSTERDRFPVRVGEDEVVDHVVERLAREGDAERVHAGEIGGGDVAGVVDLSEDDGLVGPAECPPLTDASFEGASVGVEELARMLAADPVEEGLGLESGFVAESSFDGVPDVGEGIGSGAVVAWRFGLFSFAGQGAMVAVVSCGFFGHSGPPCRVCECRPRVEIAPESSYLAIRSHPSSPSLRSREDGGTVESGEF